MKVNELLNQIKKSYNREFPNSKIIAQLNDNLGKSLYIKCLLSNDESEVANGILLNDMFSIVFWSHDLSNDITLESEVPENLTLECTDKSYLIVPEESYMCYGRRKLSYRKTTGAEKIVKALDNFFKKLKKQLVEDLEQNKIHDNHKELLINKLNATSEPVQEVSIVEELKQESEVIAESINTESLETQKESLEAVNAQLNKINDIIEENLNNEEVRQQLRDIENNLKYHYGALSEMIESEEIKKAEQQANKIKVTHNEYENICKELASRIWRNDETKITMKEYDQMLDNYIILPFEINTTNEELKKIINLYAHNETIEADRVIYRGSIDKSILYDLYQNKGYNDLYYEYYQVIICKNDLRTILTYCEGDFVAEVYNSIEEYNKGIEKTKQFIEEM
jgi:hypothetical protein